MWAETFGHNAALLIGLVPRVLAVMLVSSTISLGNSLEDRATPRSLRMA